MTVIDLATLRPVPADGRTMGEIAIRGSTVMKGYLKNPKATEEAFAGGFFHSGDLAGVHRRRLHRDPRPLKDIVVSGGEYISTIEVEQVLFRHPHVLEGRGRKRDEKWGETPCAFVTLKPGAPDVSAEDIIQWCRATLAGFKCPRSVVFTELPKTSTGKVQKVVLRQWANSGTAGT